MKRLIACLGTAVAVALAAPGAAYAAPSRAEAAPGPAGPPVPVATGVAGPSVMVPMLAGKDCAAGGPTAADAALASQLTSQIHTDRMSGIDSGQVSCARVIVDVVRGDGLPARAALLAIMTAMAESTLHDYTQAADLDSLGLYQQRPSQGWGTAAQVTDPVYATNKFLSVMQSTYPNNAWTTGDAGAICQGVQRSALPDEYDKQQAAAQVVVDALWSNTSNTRHSPVAQSADGTDVVFVDASGQLVNDYHDAGGWHGPAAIGGAPRSDSPLAERADGTGVFFVNGNGQVVNDYHNASGWNGPAAIGGTAKAGSGLAISADGTDVVFVDASGQLVNDYHDAGGWHGPAAVGGTPRADSPLVEKADGIGVFFVNGNGQVVNDYHNASGWNGPAATGGTARAGSGLAISPDGADVVFVNTSGQVVNDYHNAGGWNGPAAIGGAAG